MNKLKLYDKKTIFHLASEYHQHEVCDHQIKVDTASIFLLQKVPTI